MIINNNGYFSLYNNFLDSAKIRTKVISSISNSIFSPKGNYIEKFHFDKMNDTIYSFYNDVDKLLFSKKENIRRDQLALLKHILKNEILGKISEKIDTSAIYYIIELDEYKDKKDSTISFSRNFLITKIVNKIDTNNLILYYLSSSYPTGIELDKKQKFNIKNKKIEKIFKYTEDISKSINNENYCLLTNDVSSSLLILDGKSFLSAWNCTTNKTSKKIINFESILVEKVGLLEKVKRNGFVPKMFTLNIPISVNP